MRRAARLPRLALLLAAAAVAPAAGAVPEAGRPSEASPVVEIREGHLVNFVHRYYMPLGEAWELEGEPEADFQQLRHAGQPGVVLKILVSPGNPLPLDQTMKALRERAAEDPHLHILQEGRRRMGLREAGEMLSVRDGAASGGPPTILRTVTFTRDEDKYYLRLEAPADRYEAGAKDFEAAVEAFKFEARLRMPWQKKDER